MSWIDRTRHRVVEHLRDLFDPRCAPPEVTLGAEDERFYLDRQGRLIPPAGTQAFLAGRAAQAGQTADGRPILQVREALGTWSLEAAGVIEWATRPYLLRELPRFADDLAQMLALRDAELAKLGYHPCPTSAPPDLRTEHARAALVDSPRLRAMDAYFRGLSDEHPAMFTLFQEAVSQVSVAPRSLREAGVWLARMMRWAPLLYAATDNSAGALRGEPLAFSLRSREWARHNAFVPPGRERAGAPGFLVDIAFSSAPEQAVARYLDHVQSVPMVFYYDEDGRERRGEDLAFADLLGTSLATVANAELALSLCWFDARLGPIQTERGPWMRLEARSPDGGGPRSTWLASVLVLGALIEEQGGAASDALFAASGVDRHGHVEARRLLPERGLDTPFGRTTLRELLPELARIAWQAARRLGCSAESLRDVEELAARARSPAEQRSARP